MPLILVGGAIVTENDTVDIVLKVLYNILVNRVGCSTIRPIYALPN